MSELDIPRKRKAQKQTANIVLRKNKHREVIFDDMYHNAIYVGEDNKPAWRKYKKHLLLGSSYSNLDGTNVTGIDMEHKALNIDVTGAYYQFIVLLDYVVAYVADGNSTSNGLCISKDGYDYQRLNVSNKNWVQYGNANELLYSQMVGSYIVFKKTTITEDADGNFIATDSEVQRVLKTGSNVAVFMMGRMGTGSLVYLANQGGFYKVTDAGVQAISVLDNYILTNKGRYSVYRGGINVVPCVHNENNKSGCAVLVFKHDGAEVEFIKLTDVEHWPNSLHTVNIVWKYGYFWIYCRHCYHVEGSYNYEIKVIRTEFFDEFEEYILPDYIDLDITENAPFSTSYKKVRCIFNTDAYIPTESKVYNTIANFDTKGGNLANVSMNFANSIVDGKTDEPIEAIACVGDNSVVAMVFDNMSLSESEGNFAFITDGYDSTYGEKIDQNDFVFKRGGK